MAAELDVKDAVSCFPNLLARVRAGEEITIAEEGKPVAKLVPANEPAHERGFGIFKGRIWMSDDFQAPLSEEELKEWES